ncbi:MAG TPA: RcpC/CpaB family pilus assembly protein, partial [Burkholderiales bacterium]|nr:RcpC/CpaB family pilus assembly protein [Burkholderiales bacterium]
INGLVRPGDKLDLVVTSRSTGQAVVRPLLLGVKVLATGSLTSASTPPEGRPSANLGLSYSTITLEVSPREAEEVILARDTGQVTAMLRRRTGSEPDAQLAAMSDALQAASPYKADSRARRREIDYILGGRGDGMPQYVRVPVDMAAYVAGGGAEPRVQLPSQQQRQQSATPTVVMPQINVTTTPGALPGADMPPGVPARDATLGVPGLVNRESAK